jgi:hypothetical protein
MVRRDITDRYGDEDNLPMNRLRTPADRDRPASRLGLYVEPGDRADVASPYKSGPAAGHPGRFTSFGLELPTASYVFGQCEEGQRAGLVRSGCWIHFEPVGPGRYLFVQRVGAITGTA